MKPLHVISATGIVAAIFGCTEPYALQTRNFESALVIEASVTNELKKHAVKISRAYRFEASQTFENGATVYVEDDSGNTIAFSQQDSMYVSEEAFLPDPERSYRLHVATSDGKTYSSTPEKCTNATTMDDLTAVPVQLGSDRVLEIRVNSYDPTGMSRYYRYEYEEAGRFQVPHYSEKELVVHPDNADEDPYPELLLMVRTEDARTCYRTGRSKSIIVTATNELSEDRVVNFPVRKIADTAYILNDRYGIKVRQYVQNLPAYTFYKTLSELSTPGNILSQTQPGFFYGNIRSDQDPDEKVIGFFEVTSVSEKVLMFGFYNVFPDGFPAFFPYACTFTTYNQEVMEPGPFLGLDLLNELSAGTIAYFETDNNGLFVVVSKRCGDCRETGTNIPPPFWQD